MSCRRNRDFYKKDITRYAFEFPGTHKTISQKIEGTSGKFKIVYSYSLYLFFNAIPDLEDGYIFWNIRNALINECHARIDDCYVKTEDAGNTHYSILELDAFTDSCNSRTPVKTLYYIYRDNNFNNFVGVICEWGENGEIYYLYPSSEEQYEDDMELIERYIHIQAEEVNSVRSYPLTLHDKYFQEYLTKEVSLKQTYKEILNEYKNRRG